MPVQVSVLHWAAELLVLAAGAVVDEGERAELAALSCRLWSLTRGRRRHEILAVEPVDLDRTRTAVEMSRRRMWGDLEIGAEYVRDATRLLDVLPPSMSPTGEGGTS